MMRILTHRVTQNTDIKPENIRVGVESRSVPDEVAEDEANLLPERFLLTAQYTFRGTILETSKQA